MYQYWIRM